VVKDGGEKHSSNRKDRPRKKQQKNLGGVFLNAGRRNSALQNPRGKKEKCPPVRKKDNSSGSEKGRVEPQREAEGNAVGSQREKKGAGGATKAG